MSLRESDCTVTLLYLGVALRVWPARTVTFAQIQQVAYQKEQELNCGVEYEIG
jgi:hypothetical protein